MIKNGIGGANTNITGLEFEKNTDLYTMFINAGVSIDKSLFHAKANFSKYVKTLGVNTKDYWSKELRPDEALFLNGTIFIIEKKWQETAGSVDEKIQTCDFKRRQYEKIGHAIGMEIKYIYLLNDWFKNDSYKDVLNYIKEVGCYYFFEEIPLTFFDNKYLEVTHD